MALADLETCIVSTARGSTPDPACVRPLTAALLSKVPARELLNYVNSTDAYLRVSCHPLGHIIGAEIYRSEGTLEGALSQCTNACNGSCVHGVVGAAVADETGSQEDIAHADGPELRDVGKRYCTRSRAVCHAVGHLLYIGYGNYKDALTACDDVAPNEDSAETCYEGVFMEASSPDTRLYLDGEAPTEIAADPGVLCTSLAVKYRHACFLQLPPMLELIFERDDVRDTVERFEIAAEICTRSDKADRSDCFDGIGFWVGLNRVFDGEKSGMSQGSVCEIAAMKDDRLACTLGFAQMIVQTNRKVAFEYCRSRTDASQKNICFNVLYQTLESRGEKSEALDAICREQIGDKCAHTAEEYGAVRKSLPNYLYGLNGRRD